MTNKVPTLWDAIMEEMPRSRHDRTWAGFTGAVAGAAVLSPFLAASAVARELLRPDPNDTDVNRQLTRLANDSFCLHAEAQRIASTISFPTTQEFLRLIFEGCIERLLAENRLFPPVSMFEAFAGVVHALYDLPELSIPPEKPSDILLHTIDGARWRDATRYYIAQFSNPQLMLRLTATAFLRSFYEFICALPPATLISWDEFSKESDGDLPPASFTVSFADVSGYPGSLIMTLLLPFFAPDILEHDLFVRIRSYMIQRSDSTGSMPDDYRGTPEEVIDAYLSNTPFENLFKAPVPLRLPDEQRFSGHWIIAPPGRGKTTLLHSMFLDDLKRDASIIVMDSKGDLINPIKELQAVKDRLILIEPDPDHPLALNPLDIPKTNIAHTVSLLEYIFSALLEAKMTALQMTLFRSVLPALVEVVPNATLDRTSLFQNDKALISHSFIEGKGSLTGYDPG